MLSLLQTASCGKVLLHLPHRLRTVAYQPHAPFGFCFVLVVAAIGLAQEHDLERCLDSLLLIAVAPKLCVTNKKLSWLALPLTLTLTHTQRDTVAHPETNNVRSFISVN